MRPITLSTMLLVAIGLLLPTTVLATPITACGQVVVGQGELESDLDCSAEADEAIKLKGRLILLNNATLTGNPAFDVVRCESGPCKVVGPGTITGGADGVRSDRGARIDNVTIDGNTGDGVRTERSAKVVAAQISGNGADGVRSKAGAKITESLITGNGSDGVRADGSVKIASSEISGNLGNGADSERNIKVQSGSVVELNGFDGVRGLKVLLKDATAIDNAVDGACDVTDDCADVASERTPKVRGTSTCGTSRMTEGGGTWGVCMND